MAERNILNDLREEVIQKIAEINAAIRANDFAKVTKLEAELKATETEYATVKAKTLYGELMKEENPVKAAIEKLTYYVIGHKNLREQGELTGMEIVEDREMTIDLVKFCEYAGIKCLWRFKVSKLAHLIAQAKGAELEISKERMKDLAERFDLKREEMEAELGAVPVSKSKTEGVTISKTQICKMLQTILDEILFEDDGNGKNAYKVINRDVAFLLNCCTSKSRKAQTVNLAKNAMIFRILMDIWNRIVCNKLYTLDFKIKSVKAEAEAPASSKVSESKGVAKVPTADKVSETQKETAVKRAEAETAVAKAEK